jgi:hypothetical protein
MVKPLSLIKLHAMKAYGEVQAQLHSLLNSILDGSGWLASYPGCFTPRDRASDTHRLEGWMDLRTGLDVFKERKISWFCRILKSLMVDFTIFIDHEGP